ncbi:MAG: c-type cytochrome [Saprospiraceae bacterium]|nr:c-type cytochrome [Saprospiraceae bacterium]
MISDKNDDEFSRNIRTTDPLSPEEERMALHLPPGFEIQLFASEPDIAKPLNMSFDDRGRMWLTQSYEYPFADTTGAGKDKISILEDRDGDGRAEKISVFADSLNIPIGIQVVPDGVLAYSIPNIWHFIDHDGDDKVDERKVLYSGFKFGDTHGMVNNFVRGWDGWIHADHGFSNTSTVAGTDGDTIVMFSGNTFRFRMDGSHVEFTTTGRVNPYGYAYDELGYTYSVDCHTSPVYQLVRGADYPHFGKKPTGIGFGPALMQHDYGSTALAGLEYYIADQFPAEFRNNFYYGDVVRSRVSRNHFEMKGTTPVITQEEDFIISDDPWFRPVDVKLGPDGALYIADFYNRIIGHYEVPLDHPGRDRQRGRIWRIVYTGTAPHRDPADKDNSGLSLKELIDRLDDPNLPLRFSLANQIVDRFGTGAVSDLQNTILEDQASAYAQIQALWILFRLEGLTNDILEKAIAHPNDTFKVQTLRICYELGDELSGSLLNTVEKYLNHPDPHVQRQAVMVISRHPDQSHVGMILDLLQRSDTTDTHFYYSIRQSLRDQIRDQEVLAWTLENRWEEADSRLLADVMVGVDAEGSAQFLLGHLSRYPERLDKRELYARHVARWLPEKEMNQLVSTLRPLGKDTPDENYAIFLSVIEGMQQGGKSPGQAEKEWASDLAADFLKTPVQDYAGWSTTPLDRQPYPANSWLINTDSTDDGKALTFISSGPLGASGSWITSLQSPTFEMPEKLGFYLRGRKNDPGIDQPPTPPTNRVELIRKEDGERIEFAEIDRLNTNTFVQWEGGEHVGELVYLNLHDGSSGWGEHVGIGGISPAILKLPEVSPEQIVERQVFAARMVSDYALGGLTSPLRQIMESEIPDVFARSAAARTLLKLQPEATLGSIENILLEDPSQKLKELLVTVLSETDLEGARKAILENMPDIPYQAQKEVVLNIGQNKNGIDFLLASATKNEINPRLLLEPQVMERMETIMNHSQKNTLATLKSNFSLPPGEIDNIINDRLRGYVATGYSPEKGQAIFSVFCSMCHEINGQGGNIGPQLTGVGNWGARALCEKILDPNRNISRAFVTYTITLKDGSVKSGLYRREEGQTLVFADQQGQEFAIDKNNINEQKESPYTLMPDHFRETIPEEDFKHLVSYLLSLKGTNEL